MSWRRLSAVRWALLWRAAVAWTRRIVVCNAQALRRVAAASGPDLTDVSGVVLAGVEPSAPPLGGAPPGYGCCQSQHRFVRTAGDMRPKSRSVVFTVQQTLSCTGQSSCLGTADQMFCRGCMRFSRQQARRICVAMTHTPGLAARWAPKKRGCGCGADTKRPVR